MLAVVVVRMLPLFVSRPAATTFDTTKNTMNALWFPTNVGGPSIFRDGVWLPPFPVCRLACGGWQEVSEFSKNAVECMHTCIWPSVDHSGVVGAASWCLGKQTPCFSPWRIVWRDDCYVFWDFCFVVHAIFQLLKHLIHQLCMFFLPLHRQQIHKMVPLVATVFSLMQFQWHRGEWFFFSFDELDNVGEMHPPIFFILHSLILFPTPSIFCMRISKALYHCRQICGWWGCGGHFPIFAQSKLVIQSDATNPSHDFFLPVYLFKRVFVGHRMMRFGTFSLNICEWKRSTNWGAQV